MRRPMRHVQDNAEESVRRVITRLRDGQFTLALDNGAQICVAIRVDAGQRSAEIADVFSHVLYVCQREGLIGRQMFAIDGVKLPSNASKQGSGTHAQLLHEAERMEAAVARMVKAR